MGKSSRSKAARTGIELLTSGELVDLVDCPNDIQNRWQFTYSFIANLCLTGWSYLIKDVSEDGEERPQMYSVPTTWVTPDHTNGPFSAIKVKNPKKPGSEGETYDRTQFAFAHLPNPSDPLSALAPASAQAISIRIDDHIQTSQEAFFHNGIFPSVLVTVGKMPLGDGQVRPRLSGSQRRQVHGAIRKAMGSIANYGNPGILDGLIERIDRLSATQNEMGWEKSEKTTRLRILSAFAIHPFILGEEMAGSYAQAYTVMERFCNRVNTYLDLLGVVLTNFFAQEVHGVGTDNIIWWEPCEPKDPEQHRRWWEIAANKNFITQNEYRQQLGLPPDADSNQQYMDRLVAAEVNKLLQQIGSGKVTYDQGVAFLQALGLPTPLAESMAAGPELPDPALTPDVKPLVEDIQATLSFIRSQAAQAQVAGLLTL
jgi:phage portal protein BeeE